MARAPIVRIADGSKKARPLTDDLLRAMGVRPDGSVNEYEARRIMSPRFRDIFRSVDKSFKTLLSKSSVRWGAGTRWQKEGGHVGAKYTYDLYNSLGMSIRYRNDKGRGFGASFTISSDSQHYGYVDNNPNPSRIPLSELLLFAIKRIPGWSHIPPDVAQSGTVNLDQLREYKVPMTSQSSRHRKRPIHSKRAGSGWQPTVSASWALYQMYLSVRRSSYRGLQLTERILQYSNKALERAVGSDAILTSPEMIAVFSPPKS